ncbi:MAG: hypothetical protein AB7S70_07090 [Hyphomicrobium sp.]|uniref:lipase family protein n=1 Tax=Hyphomicrobium sp. TaxID=82 RepID=UPI003D12F960
MLFSKAISTAPMEAPLAGPNPETFQLLTRPPHVEGIDLFSSLWAEGADDSPAAKALLPRDFQWVSAGAAGPRVPLQLCEFLAYKAGIAYESEPRIKAHLESCGEGLSGKAGRFRFFDATKAGESQPGRLADAQGYGFVFDRTAFIVFRGTESAYDWAINRIDALTDQLGGTSDRRYRDLKRVYGELLDKLGDPSPGRHVGFCIAWASIKDQVEAWLVEVLEDDLADSIVYTGHSLGGALAQVAAFDHARIQEKMQAQSGAAFDRIGAVVTFGAPAVGGNQYVDAYKALLGDRTVLLESSGDLVPRIMDRWYYRALYPLRQRVKSGIQVHTETKGGFGKVARPWTFASEPPLSDSEIDAMLRSIKEEAEKQARERDRREQSGAHDNQPKASNAANSASGKQPPSKPASSSGTPPGKPQSPDTDEPNWVVIAVVGAFALVAALLVWYFVRRKLFAHDIEQRYALYLSTLSYQQLRATYKGDIPRADEALARHLVYIRGDLAKAKALAKAIPGASSDQKEFFASVQGLPLLIKVRDDPTFIEYLKRSDTFL